MLCANFHEQTNSAKSVFVRDFRINGRWNHVGTRDLMSLGCCVIVFRDRRWKTHSSEPVPLRIRGNAASPRPRTETPEFVVEFGRIRDRSRGTVISSKSVGVNHQSVKFRFVERHVLPAKSQPIRRVRMVITMRFLHAENRSRDSFGAVRSIREYDASRGRSLSRRQGLYGQSPARILKRLHAVRNVTSLPERRKFFVVPIRPATGCTPRHLADWLHFRC
jgi:hypothetical protein